MLNSGEEMTVRFAYAWLVSSFIPFPSLSQCKIASFEINVPLSNGESTVTLNSMVIVSLTLTIPFHIILS